MSNSSRIFAIQQDGDEVVLFEGNNPLPFFWLMLLSVEDFELYKKKIDQIISGKVDSSGGILGLDKLKAISLAANRRDYIKKYLPLILPLFDDWIFFLQVSDFSDMKIYIDFYGIVSFYNGLEHFSDSLLRAIVSFDEDKESWYEVTIAGTCGHESRNKNKKRFSDASTAYQELNQEDIYGKFHRKIHLHKKPSSSKKVWFVLCFLLAASLAACIFYFIK